MGLFDDAKKALNDIMSPAKIKRSCPTCGKPVDLKNANGDYFCQTCGKVIEPVVTKEGAQGNTDVGSGGKEEVQPGENENLPPPPEDEEANDSDSETGADPVPADDGTPAPPDNGPVEEHGENTPDDAEEDLATISAAEELVEDWAPLDHRIIGNLSPLVDVELKKGQAIYASTGSINIMDPTVLVEGMDRQISSKIKTGVKNWMADEALSLSLLRAPTDGTRIRLAPDGPGTVMSIEIEPEAGLYVEKGCFLAAQASVRRVVTINESAKKVLGGTAVFRQHFTGKGLVFITSWGDMMTYELAEGEEQLIQYSLAVAYSETVIHVLRRIGLTFFSMVTGPGRIYVQSFSRGRLGRAISAEQSKIGFIKSILA